MAYLNGKRVLVATVNSRGGMLPAVGPEDAGIILEVDENGDWVLSDTLINLSEELAQLRAEFDYVPIEIISFTVDPASAEVGEELTSVIVSWKLSKEPESLTVGSEPINSAQLYSGTMQEGSLKLFSTNNPTTNTKSFSLAVTETTPKDELVQVSKSVTLPFRYPIYYGVCTQEIMIFTPYWDFNVTKALAFDHLSNFEVTAGEGEYICYCVPPAFSEPAFYIGGFEGGIVLDTTTTYTNDYGVEYKVYRSNQPNLGKTTVEIK